MGIPVMVLGESGSGKTWNRERPATRMEADMYRTFSDQLGRKHRVRMTDEEVLDRWRYWVSFFGICLLCGAALTIASGILK